jgi:hypothetical protein
MGEISVKNKKKSNYFQKRRVSTIKSSKKADEIRIEKDEDFFIIRKNPEIKIIRSSEISLIKLRKLISKLARKLIDIIEYNHLLI